MYQFSTLPAGQIKSLTLSGLFNRYVMLQKKKKKMLKIFFRTSKSNLFYLFQNQKCEGFFEIAPWQYDDWEFEFYLKSLEKGFFEESRKMLTF